jgi:YgiT-type zinc finger domain-containing protein
MKCGICKAETKEQLVTYTEDVQRGVVVIRHVPALVYTECGNTWYSGRVATRLETIVDSFTGDVQTEVAVVTYAENAA